jgi:gamma-glutamyltranspeptidase/glutathione hydrolase
MTQGMVCAPQPEAVEAGVIALKNGGNAVDAAIACGLVQTAVDPQMCGIAGFGTMHLFLAESRQHFFIDFHGRAPLATTPAMWEDIIISETEDGFGFILEGGVNDLGYKSITSPGTIRAFSEAIEEHGNLPLSELLQPAIQYCEDGFAIRTHVAAYWNLVEPAGRIAHIERLRKIPATAAIYTKPDGSIYKAGEILKNPDMAKTLRRIASHGVDDFYSGAISNEIVEDMSKHQALLGRVDLQQFKTERRSPLRGQFSGYEITTNQLPGGGAMVLEMLNILSHFDLKGMGHNSADYIVTVAEAMKIATADKDKFMGDPRYVDVPLDHLLSEKYAQEMAERIKAGSKTHVPKLVKGADNKDTTHVCAVDEFGNCVTMTHSLGNPSGVVTEGLGFMYNGCMNVFDPRPGHTDSLAPGKSRFTAMSPTIVFKDEKPYLIIGAPGGTYITMGVLQGILNVLIFEMTAQEAVAAPRICVTSDIIDITNRIPRFIEAEVKSRGYEVRRSHLSYHFSGVHAIRITDSGWDGGADPGRDGMAMQVSE